MRHFLQVTITIAFLLITVLLISIPLISFSQKRGTITLSGTAYSNDGELLKNGFLTFSKNRNDLSTITDSLGHFRVAGLQKGNYRMHFEIMKGYYYRDMTLTIAKSSHNIRLIFEVVK